MLPVCEEMGPSPGAEIYGWHDDELVNVTVMIGCENVGRVPVQVLGTFDILEKVHVGVTPGIDFGANGEGYLRFSYANSMQNIVEGMNRIEAYLSQVTPKT